ncbi:MAG: L-threonylcarbamoyladenylate synthase [Rectinemataceae bacterium]|jgi:L-threonylcarbamoyladenylate synthase
MAERLEPDESNLRRAGECIAHGGLVAFPTETVYGLGADAFDARAVARIFEAKARPSFDPLIVHVASIRDVDRVAEAPGLKARALMEALWPGPLTLVMPKLEAVPDIVTSGLGTVALRLPAHPVARAIIAYSGTVVAAPSANPFGRLSPTLAEHVVRGLGDKVDIIVDGGPCSVGLESTVLDMTVDPPRVLRPGGMPVETIEAVIGPIDKRQACGVAAASPGLLENHYAPHTPLYLVELGALASARPKGKAAILILSAASRATLDATAGRFALARYLSSSGDLVEAAAGLFAALHELDAGGFDQIWAELAPNSGLGPAINDRLKKASKK